MVQYAPSNRLTHQRKKELMAHPADKALDDVRQPGKKLQIGRPSAVAKKAVTWLLAIPRHLPGF
ncbi:hypothetical protein AB4Y32_38695 [Paraburkholderia phymatum]|uniref:Uncharacterized protein n=1 Tax=Paraburkholderia phymatum TaxID=148447 RepID=A0ACC6UD71_9BURK